MNRTIRILDFAFERLIWLASFWEFFCSCVWPMLRSSWSFLKDSSFQFLLAFLSICLMSNLNNLLCNNMPWVPGHSLDQRYLGLWNIFQHSHNFFSNTSLMRMNLLNPVSAAHTVTHTHMHTCTQTHTLAHTCAHTYTSLSVVKSTETSLASRLGLH